MSVHKTIAEAAEQAKANADRFGIAYAFFTDTSGNARCERCPELTGCANVRTIRTDQPSWSGVRRVIVQPNSP